MSEIFEIYPTRCYVQCDEDRFGPRIFLEVGAIDGDCIRLLFNDSNDCAMIDKIVCRLIEISQQLCRKKDWEERCHKCPDD
jgi:hypothetical protein